MKKFRVYMKVVYCDNHCGVGALSCDIGSVLREARNIDNAVTAALAYAVARGFPDVEVWHVEFEEGGL